MSWLKITLPLTVQIDPVVVEIGNLAKATHAKENNPKGFAMFHATRGVPDGLKEDEEIRIVYLSPVAAELCKEITENYEVEPCDVPFRDEPDIAFVFGDPLVMGHLRENFQQSKIAAAEA